MLGEGLTFWALMAWLASAFFAGHVAAEKGRWGFIWFVWGVIVGPLALIATVGLPVKPPKPDRI